MALERRGSFNDIHDSDYPLERDVKYKNADSTQSIKSIEVLGFSNGSIEIYAKTFNAEKYAPIYRAMQGAGLDADPDRTGDSFHLYTYHLDLVGHYLKILAQVAPECEIAKQDIAQALGIDLNQPYVLPVWRKEGDFNKTETYEDGILRRYVQYIDSNPAHFVKSLKLMSKNDTLFIVELQTRDARYYQALMSVAVAAGLEGSKFDNTPSDYLTVSSTEPQHIINFIEILARNFPELDEIKQDYIDGLKQVSQPDPLLAPVPSPIVYNRNRIRQSELRDLSSEAQAFIGSEPLAPRRRNP